MVAIRQAGDEFPVMVKLNASDAVNGGLEVEESIRIAQRLQSLDSLSC